MHVFLHLGYVSYVKIVVSCTAFFILKDVVVECFVFVACTTRDVGLPVGSKDKYLINMCLMDATFVPLFQSLK
jgi:hypothetical protein